MGTEALTSRTRRQAPAYVPAIDGLRGLAVLWIVVLHCWGVLGQRMPLDGGPLRYLVASGYFGLDLLLVITGFVLFLPAAQNGGSVGPRRDYALRRAARVVPGFWVATLIAYLVALRLGEVRGGPVAWLTHLTFLHQYAHSTQDVGFGINRAMWTMTVEATFYAVLPLVARPFHRRPLAGVGAALLVAEGWHQLTLNLGRVFATADESSLTDAQARMAYVFPSYVAHFAFGMAAAWLYVRMRRRRRVFPSRLASAPAAAAVIGIAALALVRGRQRVSGELGPFDERARTLDRTVLMAVLVLAVALASPRAQSVVTNGFARLVGTVSYGIYLSHMPLIYLLMPALGIEAGTTSNGDLALITVIVVPLSIAVGVVSYVFIEQPFRRFVRRGRGAAAGGVPGPLRPVAPTGARG
jgi:peptidoglycan/LPS O-acetylase OafA/YrhL